MCDTDSHGLFVHTVSLENWSMVIGHYVWLCHVFIVYIVCGDNILCNEYCVRNEELSR